MRVSTTAEATVTYVGTLSSANYRRDVAASAKFSQLEFATMLPRSLLHYAH